MVSSTPGDRQVPPAVAWQQPGGPLRQLGRPAVLPTALVLANVAAYALVALYAGGDVWERLQGGDGLHYALLRCGGKSNDLIRAGGEPWRLLSAVFLHGSLLHLAINAAGIWYLGRAAASAFGTRRTLLLYVVSGAAATGASVLFSEALSVGASGAVFGLTGAVGVALVRLRRELPRRSRLLLVAAPLVWVGLSLAVGWVMADVDNAAHVGGLVVGALLGLGFRATRLPGPPRRAAPAAGWLLSAAAALAVAALLGTAALAAGAALRPLPPASDRLVPGAELPGELPVPQGWRAGRLHDRRCVPRDEGLPSPPGAPWCFGDPYETLLIVGDAPAVFPGQEELVRYLEAADAPEPPVERATAAEVLFVIPAGPWPAGERAGDRGLTYVLVCYPELAERYRPLVERVHGALVEGARR
jgi:membrane associated rhomboid family serine protease